MTHQKYKLLILDYGGVYSFDYTSAYFSKILSDAFGKSPNEEERRKIIEKSHTFGEGKLTTSQYISSVTKLLEVPDFPTVEKFEGITISVTNPPSDTMKKLVKNVRKAGIKVSLLSDMYMFEIKKTRPTGRYKGFDYTAFSAESGMTNRNSDFFKQTLGYFNIAAEDALFVDDGKANIEVAQSIGLNTLYVDKQIFNSAEQLAQRIREILQG